MLTLACFTMCTLLLISLHGITSDLESEDSEDVEDDHASDDLMIALFSPLRLLWRKATLRAVCMVAAFLTLGELAASDISAQVLYSMLDITSDAQWQDTVLYFNCFPMPLTFIVIIWVGIASRRYSPHRFVRAWLPITSVLFAVPALLAIPRFHHHWAIFVAGFCSVLPLSNYGPLQVLVVHVVPPRRVGEAMGSMAACKNLVSFIAPLIIGSFSAGLAAGDNNDLLWTVYPGCALVMLCSWPFTWALEKRVPRESNAVWSSWASTARPSLWRPSLATRPSSSARGA